ncbi:MAG: type II toxin-antitoxin system RelE/ParE family toxin [Thiobacillus sp.]
MARLRYSASAAHDLARLARFLVETAPHEAARTIPLIVSALDMLRLHPYIGRRCGNQVRELVISRGKTGYVALYRYDEIRDVARVLAIRHQREAGL